MGQVLLAVLPVGRSDLAPWQAFLDPAEQAAAERFRRVEDRASYILSHGLRRALCQLVLGRQGLSFAPLEPLGKPVIVGVGQDLDVSISHTQGVVACIIGLACRVGVDLERLDRPFSEAIGQQVFTADELAWIGRHGPERSLTLWTLKEAISKAVGLGLSLGFSDLALGADPWHIHAAPAPCLPCSDWLLEVWQATPDHVAALAVQGQGRALPLGITDRVAAVLPSDVVLRIVE
jgi:4'-phosphopantetheinyl transferase